MQLTPIMFTVYMYDLFFVADIMENKYNWKICDV